MKKTDAKHVGPGRPNEGKKAYTVTLTAETVVKAKAMERNFSGLLDRLLSEWISSKSRR